jgi:hypothetical protein
MAIDTPGTGSPLGSASDNANSDEPTVKVSEVERMINDALNKALGPRLKRETGKLAESVEKIVQDRLAKLVAPQAEPTATTIQADVSAEQPLNLKTLDSRFQAMQAKIDAAERKAKEAEDRAAQTRIKSDLQSAFGRHAGQDNPHLPLYVEKYASQFRVHEGQTYRAAKNEYGEEVYIPLEQATPELFAGELKHLAAPTRPNLPPSSLVRGQPMPVPPQGKHPALGLFENEIARHLSVNDPDAYEQFIATAKKPQ